MQLPEPRRIQLSRRKEWRMPPNTVKVARPMGWGNPYRVGDPGVPDATTAVTLFRKLVGNRTTGELRALRGKNLACWCPIGAPCHADHLLKIANQ